MWFSLLSGKTRNEVHMDNCRRIENEGWGQASAKSSKIPKAPRGDPL